MADEIRRIAPRVQGHVDALREAGLNTEAFFDALVGIRDDTALPEAQRDALYRLIATESFIWYLEALRGEPVDRIKLAEQASEIAEKNAVAIKKQVPGENAAELLVKAMQDDQEMVETIPPEPGLRAAIPPDAPTKLDRPQRVVAERDEPTVRQRPPAMPADAETKLDRPSPLRKKKPRPK